MAHAVDILIPTFRRPAALAVTLASLVGQTTRDFRVIISDQTPEYSSVRAPEVQSVIRVLEAHGHSVIPHRHLPSRGMAEQRAFLLSCATAPYVLYLDDDLVLEPFVVEQLVTTLVRHRCGFVGSAVIGLTHRDDVRPHEQHIEFWDGSPQPERLVPNGRHWERHKLHNAANVYHLQKRVPCTWHEPRLYKVAWVGACVMYDRQKLEAVGGFNFWNSLPPDHAGEDVLAQLRVMERFGGCAVLPSGAYHQELPTTIENRRVNASTLFDNESSSSEQRQCQKNNSYVRTTARQIVGELSPADLLERISRLELALERTEGPKRNALGIRIAELRRTKEKCLPDDDHLRSLHEKLYHELRRVSEFEHRIRLTRSSTDLSAGRNASERITMFALEHYHATDRLRLIKQEINDYTSCDLAEETVDRFVTTAPLWDRPGIPAKAKLPCPRNL